MQDGEVLLGLKAISAELSRITGREVNEKTAAYWRTRGVYRATKRGHFVVTTRTALRESFEPEPDAAA